MQPFINAPFDSRSLRRMLGSFATGVTIVTTRSAEGIAVGMTASSFNTVSLDPALVLWSVARSSSCCALFEQAEHWAIHVLTDEQRAISDRFASSAPDRFDGLRVTSGVGDLPLLDHCLGVLQCERYAAYDGGDHVILVGRVLAFQQRDGAPLVFHGGRYARLSVEQPAAAA